MSGELIAERSALADYRSFLRRWRAEADFVERSSLAAAAISPLILAFQKVGFPTQFIIEAIRYAKMFRDDDTTRNAFSPLGLWSNSEETASYESPALALKPATIRALSTVPLGKSSSFDSDYAIGVVCHECTHACIAGRIEAGDRATADAYRAGLAYYRGSGLSDGTTLKTDDETRALLTEVFACYVEELIYTGWTMVQAVVSWRDKAGTISQQGVNELVGIHYSPRNREALRYAGYFPGKLRQKQSSRSGPDDPEPTKTTCPEVAAYCGNNILQGLVGETYATSPAVVRFANQCIGA